MGYDVTTYNTKKAFADALRTCMQSKMLSKITVSEIIRMCGVNRKTFYYHFSDIYDLLKWMLDEEAIEIVKQFDMLLDFKDAVRFVIQYVHDNKHILNCAYDSMGRDEMKRFFYNDFIGIVGTYIRNIEKNLNLEVTDEFREFLIHMYTETIAGMLIDEFKEDVAHDPEKAMDYMGIVLNNSLPNILKNGPKKG